MNDITQFRLRAHDIRYVGAGLSRPECIIAEADGTLWVADDRGGLLRFNRALTALTAHLRNRAASPVPGAAAPTERSPSE